MKAGLLLCFLAVLALALAPLPAMAQQMSFKVLPSPSRATFKTNHGMKVPELLLFKLSNDIQIEADLTLVRQ